MSSATNGDTKDVFIVTDPEGNEIGRFEDEDEMRQFIVTKTFETGEIHLAKRYEGTKGGFTPRPTRWQRIKGFFQEIFSST